MIVRWLNIMKFGTKLKNNAKNKTSLWVCLWWKIQKAKLKAFNDVVSTVFSDDKIPKESVHYTCIAAINIDSVMKAN